MRCLYCGKELALLKRWTSGGEFCSDAHRQQYQEEYNQLALNRLLQAKPRDAKSEGERKGTSKATESMPAKPVVQPVSAEIADPAKTAEPATVARMAEPQPRSVSKSVERVPEPRMDDSPAPAEAGFLLEMPVAAMAGVRAMAAAETDFDRRPNPVLPCLSSDAWEKEPVTAGQVVWQPSTGMVDSAARLSEGRLEVREFVRAAPVVGFDLRAAGQTGIVESSEEPMDILFFPQPPQESAPLWNEGERDFSFTTELGPLARVIFRTTGVEDNESGDATGETAPIGAPSSEPALPPVELDHFSESAAPAPAIVPKPVRETPRPVPIVVKVAAPAKASFVRPPTVKPDEPVAPAAPETKTETVPELATKPLPVTLHGLAAGRGKPVQVFPSAVSGAVDIQVPRSNALPLRPVMVLGPAAKDVPAKETKEERKPAERVVPVKSDSRKQSPQQRPDPRFSNGKVRKVETEKAEPEKAAPEKKVTPAAAAAKEPVAKPEPIKESPKEHFPAPLAKPYSSSDLGLPSLTLDTGGSFWSRLPIAGKAGVGLAAALAIGGIIFAMSRGSSGTAASSAPHVVEAGPALTAIDSGWITDWGAEPGVRRERDISVLRPSLNMSDYRMQFEAQIETKALGWVYRAKDGKNFYVTKLEIVKPGLTPTVALVRFAVINGEEQPRAQFPLSMPLHLDTLYKVRFDAVGDRFTTYVQDQKVDEWTDDRLKMGGVGLYNERNERMSLKGTVNVVPLVIKR